MVNNTDPEQKRSFLDVIQAQDSLERLTLRQLRHKASDLGVPLYSRKSKASLVKEIVLYQEKQKAIALKKSDVLEHSATRVVFLPRDPRWAYVFWEISEAEKNLAISQGASRLCLRLLDVTGTQDGKVNKQTMQEVPVESHSTEWYLPIPMSDRDYRVELGYRCSNRWISLAFSSPARVPALQPSNEILDQFVPFSLDSNPTTTDTDELIDLPLEQKDNGLHQRLYLNATAPLRKTRIGSEEFQEHNSSNFPGTNDSGVGLWASGINESGLGGVSSQPDSFWLVADAELIVYGSTDPAAELTIGGENIPLSSDGTFRIQVPFRDGSQKYPIEATLSESNQKRNILMQFERLTPEDNTNPREKAKVEWF